MNPEPKPVPINVALERVGAKAEEEDFAGAWRQVRDARSFHVIAVGSSPGAIDELVAHDEMPRLDGRLQAADGRRPDDTLDSQLFEGPQIRAIVDRPGRNRVLRAVARHEGDAPVAGGPDCKPVARLAEWRIHLHLLDVVQQPVQPRAAENTNRRRPQVMSPFKMGISPGSRMFSMI